MAAQDHSNSSGAVGELRRLTLHAAGCRLGAAPCREVHSKLLYEMRDGCALLDLAALPPCKMTMIAGTLCRLKVEDNGCAAGLEVFGLSAAVLIAKNGGAKAEPETGCFLSGLGGAEGIKGAFRLQKARA